MGKITVITSGKGGVGKTTATAALGCSLAMQGCSVALMDMDMGLRNLDAVLGLENRVVYDLRDVLEDRCTVEEALVRHPICRGVWLMPSPRGRQGAEPSSAALRAVIAVLATEHDHVLLDCPAGIGDFVIRVCGMADQAVVVTLPDVTAVRDAAEVLQLLKDEQIPARLLLNRVRPELVRRGHTMRPEAVAAILNATMLGICPEDAQVIACNNHGVMLGVHPGKAGSAYARMARRLTGERVPMEDPTAGGSLWQWMICRRHAKH